MRHFPAFSRPTVVNNALKGMGYNTGSVVVLSLSDKHPLLPCSVTAGVNLTDEPQPSGSASALDLSLT